MEIYKKLRFRIANIAKHFPLPLLLKLRNIRIIIPVYHTVSNRWLPHAVHLFKYRSVRWFEDDLNFFLKEFQPICLSDFLSYIKNDRRPPKNSCLLTFDDGYREIYEIVAPILLKRSIPAIFFLNTAFIDNKDMSYRNKASVLVDKLNRFDKKASLLKCARLLNCEDSPFLLSKAILNINYYEKEKLIGLAEILEIDFGQYLMDQKPYVSSLEVAELIGSGFSIGAHSVDHPPFNTIPYEAQIEQVKNSLDFICKKFEVKLKAFAFPFSDNGISKLFFEKTHLEGLIDISFGTNDFLGGHCSQNFQRQPMERDNRTAVQLYKDLLS
jgi:peptidoglycan/xylan/chitin deacetylase (PgdA/CDA1 family)